MTPRSGSTALSATLAATRKLGAGGERLNQNNPALHALIEKHRPRTRHDLLWQVIDSTRTPNGVGQIKCGLVHILPFLMDPDCRRTLRRATWAYLTRENLVLQAVSRFKGFQTGVLHSNAVGDEGPADADYDFEAINNQVNYLLRSMSSAERTFAYLALHPIRITYEQLLMDPRRVIERLAAPFGVAVPDGIELGSGGYSKLSTSNNEALAIRFLADAEEHVAAASR